MALDRRSTRWMNRGPVEEAQAQANRDRAAARRGETVQPAQAASSGYDRMPLADVVRAARAGSEDAMDALTLAGAIVLWGSK